MNGQAPWVLTVLAADASAAVYDRQFDDDAPLRFLHSEAARDAVAQLIEVAGDAADRLDDAGRSSKALRAAIAKATSA